MEDLLQGGQGGQFWATHNIKFLPRKLKIYPNLHQEKLGQETTAQIRWECQTLFVKDFYIYHNPQPAIFFYQRLWSSHTYTHTHNKHKSSFCLLKVCFMFESGDCCNETKITRMLWSFWSTLYNKSDIRGMLMIELLTPCIGRADGCSLVRSCRSDILYHNI